MTKGERTKKKLLEIAFEMFLSKGYEETSVDDILNEAQIAKGTYYYYFKSKEQMLEEVIGLMIDSEAESAEKIAASDMSALEKIVGIITSFRPGQKEQPIGDLLNRPENLLMHKKIQQRLMEKMIPMLCGIAEDGIRNGIFNCDHVPERIKVILITGSALFDEGGYTAADTEVFIDLLEKMLGAEKGTMDIVRTLISAPAQE